MVDDRIREEVFYREALALNLDDNDALVRRRLADKLELALIDVVAMTEPKEGELRAHYKANLERYRESAELSLTHKFFNADERGERAAADAAAALERLHQGDAIDDDSFHASKTLTEQSSERLVRVFGTAFRDALLTRASGPDGADSWFGPVPSAYGFHLVRIDAFTPSRQRDFEDAREQVLEDWRRETGDAEEEQRYREMLALYEVEVAPYPAAKSQPLPSNTVH